MHDVIQKVRGGRKGRRKWGEDTEKRKGNVKEVTKTKQRCGEGKGGNLGSRG